MYFFELASAAVSFHFVGELAGLTEPFSLFDDLEAAQGAFFDTTRILRAFVEPDFAGLQHFTAFDHALVEAAQERVKTLTLLLLYIYDC